MQRLNKEQAAIIGAYTGYLIGPFEDVQAYAEKKLGRPILTHEFAFANVWEDIRNVSKDDFLALAYLGEQFCPDCGLPFEVGGNCWRCTLPKRSGV